MRITLYIPKIFCISIMSICFISCSSQRTLPTGIQVGQRSTLLNGLEVHDYKLKNGMRLILVPNHDAPVFYIQTLVQTGSVQEALDKKLKRTGLAHLFEHMMFKGTPKYPSGKYDKLLSAAGEVGLNATTWFDRTNYFVNLPAEKIELILKLESDRFENLYIDEKLFKNEIGAVLGELKLGKDRPGTVAYEELMRLIFGNHPYGHPVIGLKDDVASFTVEEAIYFYKKYYSPNNFTMLIIGDIDVGRTIRLVQKYYSHMSSQKIEPAELPEIPGQIRSRSKTITHHAAKNRSLRVGFQIPQYNHVDAVPLQLLGTILGDGDGALLQRTMVDAGLASSISVYSLSLKEAGVFAFNAEIRPGVSKSSIEDAIWSGVKKIASGNFTDRELKRAKNANLLYNYYQINSNSGIAGALVEGILNSGDYNRFFTNLDELKTVTRQDIVRVASHYLKKKKSSTIYMTPEKKNAQNAQNAIK